MRDKYYSMQISQNIDITDVYIIKDLKWADESQREDCKQSYQNYCIENSRNRSAK